MPVNDKGEEVNEDGTPVTDEQKETHDWTAVIELHNKTKVKPYSIEELATSSVPHNIPYLEVYRTDEVMYRPYKSPYLTEIDTSGSSSGDSGSGDGSSSSSGSLWTDLANIVNNHITVTAGKKNQYIQRLRDAKTDWTSIAKIVNGHKIFGNATQDTVIRAILDAKKNANSYVDSSGRGVSSGSAKGSYSASISSKNRNAKLKNELNTIVKNNFKKKANYKTLVNRYMGAKTNKSSIASVTNRSSVWLKSSVSPSSVNNAVYNAKHKYS